MIEFFMPMVPPKTTAQMHKLGVRNGKPFVYDPPEVVQMKQKLKAHLSQHAPDCPMEGPLELVVKWIWPHPEPETTDTNRYKQTYLECVDKHKPTQTDDQYRWKPTKPDTDNLQKAIKDIMARVGFYRSDAQVASEITNKFWGPIPGIYIKLRELEFVKND